MAQWRLTADGQLSWCFSAPSTVYIDRHYHSLSLLRLHSVFLKDSLYTCHKGTKVLYLIPCVLQQSLDTQAVGEPGEEGLPLLRHLYHVFIPFTAASCSPEAFPFICNKKSHRKCLISLNRNRPKKVRSQYCRALGTGACIINVFVYGSVPAIDLL